MSDSTTTPTPEWIAANAALDMFIRNGHNPDHVMAMLAQYLRAGSLHARAEATWVSTEINLGKAWKTDDIASDVERQIVVPVKYWRSDIRARDDRERWRWPFNKFFYTLCVKPIRRRMFKGVEFSLKDLEELQPTVFSGKKPRNRGRNPEIDKRDAGWLAMLRLAVEDGFNRQTYPTQRELEEVMQEKLKLKNDKLAVGQNQITEIVRMAFHLVPKAP